ncbi:sensor domain-containing protein [Aquicella siphonis]|nr:diguanylate cyclase [Aquicella siphonis]
MDKLLPLADKQLARSKNDGNRKIILFYFFILFFPFALIVSCIFYGILKIDTRMEMLTLQTRELSQTEVAAHLFEYENRIVTSDLLFLAQVPALKRYADSQNASEKDDFIEAFTTFARQKRIYDNIHYFDNEGLLVAQVHLTDKSSGNHASNTANKENQGIQHIFLKTLPLSEGNIYMSMPSQIELGHALLNTPIIYFATPVFGFAGKKNGILLLHLSGNTLLTDFHKAMKGEHTVYLLNSSGHRLNPSMQDSSDNMPGDTSNFAQKYPGIWSKIKNTGQGSLVTEQGLFTYTTFNPLHDPELNAAQTSAHANLHQTGNSANSLKIVTFIPADKLPNPSLSRYPLIMGIYLGSLLLVSMLATVMAVMIVNRKKVVRALQQSIMEVQDLYENAPCGYHSIDHRGVFLRMNLTELKWLGYMRDEVIGKLKITDILSPSSRDRFEEIFTRFKREGSIQDIEYEMQRKDGSMLMVLLNSTAVYDARGNYIMSRTTVFDNTRRKQMEYALRESEERFRKVMEYAPIGMAIVSLEGKFQRVNLAFCEILGYSRPELEQLTFHAITHPDDLPADLRNVERMLAGKLQFYKTEKRYIRKNGEIIWGQLTATIIRDNITNTPLYFIAQIENIAERKLYHEKIHQLAYHDSLTNLPNRHLLVDRINQSLAHAERNHKSFAVLFLDIDGFKQINDSLGHDAGDELLQTLATRLRHTLRANDTAARLSGDEFVIILADTMRHESIAVIADKILEALGKPAEIRGHVLQVSVSIGIALYPYDGSNAARLIKNADTAMYAAKNAGKNQYQFYRATEMTE